VHYKLLDKQGWCGITNLKAEGTSNRAKWAGKIGVVVRRIVAFCATHFLGN